MVDSCAIIALESQFKLIRTYRDHNSGSNHILRMNFLINSDGNDWTFASNSYLKLIDYEKVTISAYPSK